MEKTDETPNENVIVFGGGLWYAIRVEVLRMDARLMEAETIVFDVDNVLLSFEPEKVLALLPEQGRDEMLRALFGSAMLWGGFDLGRDGNDAVAERIAQAAGFPEAKQYALDLLRRFPETMAPLPLYGMLEELHARGKRLYGLTNYPEPSFTLTCARFPHLVDTLDGVIVSSREKIVKPSPEIFRLLQSRFHLNPADTLFIDDSLANVEAAARLGFRVWHYAGSGQL